MPSVVLFIDYQNTYKGAREAFQYEADRGSEGQFHPIALGELICRSKQGAELQGVRIYRGLPNSNKQPRDHAATQRQIAYWKQNPRVTVITRPLKYQPGTDRPREKGLDVSLAIDFVLMAAKTDFDIGIIFSADTDLIPALEAVLELGTATPEVAAWKPTAGYAKVLQQPGLPVAINWIDRTGYQRVRDPRDYNLR